MVRDQKPKGFFYLDHRTVNGQANIITDVHVTAGNVHDARPYIARLDRQKARFGFQVNQVGLDAGYFTSAVCKALERRNIYAVMGYRRPTHKKGYFYKREYRYSSENDSYICPQGQQLIYKTTDRNGYKHYASNPEQCRGCPVLMKCTQNKKHVKTVTRHIWEESKERIDAHRLTTHGKAVYKRRKETVERSFADVKQLHGYHYARFHGLEKVKEQCLMTAAAQNIKKIALMAS